jgi:putative oxidoreductase
MMKTVLTSLWQAACDAGLERPRQMAAAPAALTSQLRWLALLLARLHVAQVFLLSGLSKLRDWEITLALFQDEYHVPLLSPELAAWLGTAGELLLPVLLILGLATRFAAAGLSVVNVVAVLSLAEIAPAALLGHQLWGTLLLALLLCGAGRWSVDGWRAGLTHGAGT